MSITQADCVHDNEGVYLPNAKTAAKGVSSTERASASEGSPLECPICAAHRDPVTGEERFNAETVAAIREGRAMMRGEIHSELYSSFDEMWEDLMKEEDD